MTSAEEGVQQGVTQSAGGNAEAVRQEEGHVDLLCQGKQVRQGKVECQAGEQRVLEEESQGQAVEAQAPLARQKLIDGQWHHLCSGPAHDEPTYLPATDKYFYRYKKTGKLLSQCRLCHQWRRVKAPTKGSVHGLVPIRDAWPIVMEAVTRVGLEELARRSEVSSRQLGLIVTRRVGNVRKDTLRKIILQLVSIKRKGEFSISTRARTRLVKRMNGSANTCSGCGTSLANYTEDCDVCWERRRGRARRGAGLRD